MPSANSTNYYWFSTSGSVYDPGPGQDFTNLSGNFEFSTKFTGSQWPYRRAPRRDGLEYEATGSIITDVVTESLTIRYFQRVWDASNNNWCYYTKTTIDTSPGTNDTIPVNSGNIVSSSVVRILEIY